MALYICNSVAQTLYLQPGCILSTIANMKQIPDILHKNNLVRTSYGEEIMQAIAASIPIPKSKDEIQSNRHSIFDRTTFLLTFKTLIAKKTIHKTVIDKPLSRQVLNQNPDTEKNRLFFTV
jgi:hypothetical protein